MLEGVKYVKSTERREKYKLHKPIGIVEFSVSFNSKTLLLPLLLYFLVMPFI